MAAQHARAIGLLLASMFVLQTSACRDVLLIDPEVTYAETLGSEVTGEFSLTLGIYEEQLFTPLQNGDEIPVVNGFQGGTWIMPALRCTGVTETVSMEAQLILETGEVLGVVDSFDSRLDRTPAGSLDANAVPVPVNREDPTMPLDDVFGQTATFRIQLRDQLGSTGVLELELVLIQG